MTFKYFLDRDVNIHYEWIDSRKSNTLVFINALGSDLRIWDAVVDRFRSQANILRFDKQGHGLSSLAPDTNRLEHYMNDLTGLMQHLLISRCHLIGLSVGGMIAQLLAYEFPSLVDKLILCGTRHKIGDAAGWNARIKQVETGAVASISGSIIERWFPSHFRQDNPEIVDGIRTMLNRCDKYGYIRTCMAIRDADLTEQMKQLTHPTLCLVGSEDGSTSVADVKSLADIIPGSRFEIIKGSGHLPCVDNAKELSYLISDFI